MNITSLTTEQDCVDFIHGCLFLATGGGGSPDEGLPALLSGLHDELDIGWVDASTIGDDALTITAYSNGSIAPRDPATDLLIESLKLGAPESLDDAMASAVSELSRYLGQEIACIVPVELGASNTPSPLLTGARLGIPVADGDYSGRAVPEELQGTPFIHGFASHPFTSVDSWGNVAIVNHTTNAYMLERISKMLSIAGIEGTAVASTPLQGRDMKRIIVAGTLTKCLEIGRASRSALDDDEDPVAAGLEAAGGWRLFDGVVTKKDWEDRDGYMFGTVEITGTGASKADVLRVWFKNENHVTWLNGEPWVCSPDLVSLVDPDTGRGFTSTDIKEGDRVTAVGMRGLDVFRTTDALREASGPVYFGFDDVVYRPIEDIAH